MQHIEFTNLDCNKLPFFTTNATKSIYDSVISSSPDNWRVKKSFRGYSSHCFVVYYRPYTTAPYRPVFYCFEYALAKYLDVNGKF